MFNMEKRYRNKIIIIIIIIMISVWRAGLDLVTHREPLCSDTQ